ncbi:MAG: hypothetical protein H7232_00205 [Aeromicrobium sp.]|nr:hypothetical protein [Burkholderiales bacterium]
MAFYIKLYGVCVGYEWRMYRVVDFLPGQQRLHFVAQVSPRYWENRENALFDNLGLYVSALPDQRAFASLRHEGNPELQGSSPDPIRRVGSLGAEAFAQTLTLSAVSLTKRRKHETKT